MHMRHRSLHKRCACAAGLAVALVVLLQSPQAFAQTDLHDTDAILSAVEPPEVAQEQAEQPVIEIDVAAQLYRSKCMGCHTIGGGALTGPDLAPTLAWPRENLVTAIVRMEEKIGPIPAQEIDQLIELLQSGQAKDRLDAERARMDMLDAATLEPGSPAIGQRLFEGRDTFSAGGLACAACHQAAGKGGSFAVDLTHIYTRMGGKDSLQSACEGTNFPVMREAYRTHPVTKQEARHLVAYFEQVDAQPDDASISAMPLLVKIFGASGCLLIFMLLGLMHVRRGTGVRSGLVKQSLKGNRS